MLFRAGCSGGSPLLASHALHWLLYRLPLAQAGQPPVHRVFEMLSAAWLAPCSPFTLSMVFCAGCLALLRDGCRADGL
eukprot:scaffold18379_cov60-Phaeocystis_antarctica.AAC.1